MPDECVAVGLSDSAGEAQKRMIHNEHIYCGLTQLQLSATLTFAYTPPSQWNGGENKKKNKKNKPQNRTHGLR